MRGDLRQRALAGEMLLGTFVKLPSLAVVEMLGEVGFDFIIVDMEHSALDFERVEGMITAADAVGLATLIRVSDNQEHLITKALDLGCDGVQVPMVETEAQARNVVKASRYHPQGQRSISFATRSARFGRIPRDEHIEDTNSNQVVCVQVETKAGVKAADNIAGVEGVDLIFVGPADLSQSFGFPGQSTRPEVTEAVREVALSTKNRGKALGSHANNSDHARSMVEAGVNLLVYKIDMGFFMQGAVRALAELKEVVT